MHPGKTRLDVFGQIDVDPFDIVDGYSERTYRTIRIQRVRVSVDFYTGKEPTISFKGDGQQVRKDGSLGRDASGITLRANEVLTQAALRHAALALREATAAALAHMPADCSPSHNGRPAVHVRSDCNPGNCAVAHYEEVSGGSDDD